MSNENSPRSHAKSGAQKRKERLQRAAQESVEHRERLLAGGVISAPKPCTDVEFSHLWELRRLVDYQYQVDTDPVMKLPDKIRTTIAIATAMAKINLQADMERRVLGLQASDRARVRKFQELQDRLELERRISGEKNMEKEDYGGV